MEKDIFLGRYHNPSVSQTVYITSHELGHALFSFQHSDTGLMYWQYGGGGNDPFNFNSEQIVIIKNSVWGQ